MLVRFLEELKARMVAFEIFWPLKNSNNIAFNLLKSIYKKYQNNVLKKYIRKFEHLLFKKSNSSTSSVSDANDAKVSVKMSVKMPDMKERKHSAKVVRKSKVVYYMADEDLKYLKKKTRYTEGELRYFT